MRSSCWLESGKHITPGVEAPGLCSWPDRAAKKNTDWIGLIIWNQ